MSPKTTPVHASAAGAHERAVPRLAAWSFPVAPISSALSIPTVSQQARCVNGLALEAEGCRSERWATAPVAVRRAEAAASDGCRTQGFAEISPSPDRARFASERPRKRPAVDQDVLTGDEAGPCASQKGTEGAKFGRIAETASRAAGLRLGARSLERYPAAGGAFNRGTLPVGVEGSR